MTMLVAVLFLAVLAASPAVAFDHAACALQCHDASTADMIAYKVRRDALEAKARQSAKSMPEGEGLDYFKRAVFSFNQVNRKAFNQMMMKKDNCHKACESKAASALGLPPDTR